MRSIPCSTCGCEPSTAAAPDSIAACASATWYGSGPLLPSRPQWKKGMTRSACAFAAATSSRTILSTTASRSGGPATPAVVSVAKTDGGLDVPLAEEEVAEEGDPQPSDLDDGGLRASARVRPGAEVRDARGVERRERVHDAVRRRSPSGGCWRGSPRARRRRPGRTPWTAARGS